MRFVQHAMSAGAVLLLALSGHAQVGGECWQSSFCVPKVFHLDSLVWHNASIYKIR